MRVAPVFLLVMLSLMDPIRPKYILVALQERRVVAPFHPSIRNVGGRMHGRYLNGMDLNEVMAGKLIYATT